MFFFCQKFFCYNVDTSYEVAEKYSKVCYCFKLLNGMQNKSIWENNELWMLKFVDS